MIEYKHFLVGQIQTNGYILYSTEDKNAFVIDPGDHAQVFIDFLQKAKLVLKGILLTHGHIDHCGGIALLKKEFDVPLMIHQADKDLLRSDHNLEFADMLGLPLPPKPDRLLNNRDQITEGDLDLTVIHTPGHTRGSVCFHIGNYLFTGDTLFAGSIGRTDLPGGDFRTIQNSLGLLRTFHEDTIILPGHGDFSTIGEEIRHNPFL
jgi:glyoxylase-like metal-dependent hydrolase (beta-lactamase superfamily II)